MSISPYPTLPARLRAEWQRQRQTRADISTEWIMHQEKWETWRLSALQTFGWVIGLLVAVDVIFAFWIYATSPNYHVWQIQLAIGLEIVYIINSFSVVWLARMGKGDLAGYVYLAGLWLVIGTGPLLVQGLDITVHYAAFLAAFLVSALLLPKRQTNRLVALNLGAWLLLSVANYLVDIAVTSPESVQVISVSMPVAVVVLISTLAVQFYRLSLNNKILLTFMVALMLMYQVVLGYSNIALTQVLNQSTTEGVTATAVVTPPDQAPAAVGVPLDNRAALSASVRIYQKTLQLILNLLVGGISVAVLGIAQVITRPVTRLTEAAIQVRQGQLDTQAQVSSLDEMGVLSLTFNQMIAQLSETLENMEAKVAARTRDLAVVADVSQDITQALSLKELLPQVVERTREYFESYSVSVWLYDDATRSLKLAAEAGKAYSVIQVISLNAATSLIAQAAREHAPVVVNDLTQSSAYLPDPGGLEAKSEAAFPMMIGSNLIGVLNFESEKLGRFQEADVQILATLTKQIGIAVRNAQLYEEQVRVAEQLRSVDRLKMQFLASMSHELRTPMNAIINFVEMVSTGLVGPVNEEQHELLEQSLQSSKHLLHLINDVLDISKIQAGKLTLFVEPAVNVQTELNLVLGMIAPSLAGRDVELIQDIDDGLPRVSGDRRRIRQILLNLLANAVKFTAHGSITVSVKRQPGQILFAVIDTGPGISPAAQEVIFEPFVQTVDGLQQAEGTGLGLPIARSLAEAHGGRLWVDSQPGEGAAFFFTLPVADEPTNSSN